MPDIILRDPDPVTGYSDATNLKCLMLFPRPERRDAQEKIDLFWKAEARQATFERLHDQGEVGGWPIRISRDDLELIMNGPSPESFLTTREITTLKRSGYMAGDYLRFFLRLRTHLPSLAEGPLAGHTVAGWLAHFKGFKVAPIINAEEPEDAGKLFDVLKKSAPGAPASVARMIKEFAPVAHLWAVAIQDGGAEARITKQNVLSFLAAAEAVCRVAVNLGFYNTAPLKGDERSVYRLVTSLPHYDPMTDRTLVEPLAAIKDVQVKLPEFPAAEVETIERAIRRAAEEATRKAEAAARQARR